jgi:hypothetical protein
MDALVYLELQKRRNAVSGDMKKINKKKKLKSVDANSLLKKKKKIKFILTNNAPSDNYTPIKRRIIYKKYNVKCRYCYPMKNQLFAHCIHKKINKYIPINSWTNDYNIDCFNCQFCKIGLNKKIKFIKNNDYHFYIKKFNDRILKSNYLGRLNCNSVVINLLNKNPMFYGYAILNNIPFMRK